MKYQVNIGLEGAAFESEDGPSDYDRANEVARILRELADSIQAEGDLFVGGLRDLNGNRVGNAAFRG